MFQSKHQHNIQLESDTKLTTKELAFHIIIAFTIALILSLFAKPTLVSGSSMYPTLKNSDYLFLNCAIYKMENPLKGDIVVFRSHLNNEILIKRVIASEGDKIQIDSGSVYVNNTVINEPYIHGQKTLEDLTVIIPKGYVFVMGDNRNNSLDSRFQEVGLVENSSIIGKAVVRLFPFNAISKIS